MENHSIAGNHKLHKNRNNHHESHGNFTSTARRFIAEPTKLGREDELPSGTHPTVRWFLGGIQKLHEKQRK